MAVVVVDNGISNIGGSRSPNYDWAPFDVPGALMYFSAHQDNMWQGHSAGTGVPKAASDNDRVGRIYDPCNGMVAIALGEPRRPQRIAGPKLLFDGGTSIRNLEVAHSKKIFRSILEDGAGSIVIRLEITADGQNQILMDSNRGTGVNDGLYVRRNASGTLLLYWSRAGGVVLNATTTDTLTTADGETTLSIICDGSDCTVQIGDGTPESFALANLGALTNPNYPLSIGGPQIGTSSPMRMELKDFLLTDTEISASDLAAVKSYDLNNAPATFLRQLGGYPWFNFCERAYDFTDTETMFQSNNARTTAVVSNNDPVGTVRDVRDVDDVFGKDLNAGSDALRPLYQSDGTGILFDGSDDELIKSSGSNDRGAARTFVTILRNLDDTNGSHLLVGDAYWSISGADYVGNPGGLAYHVLHTVSGTAPTAQLGDENGFNAIAVREDGDLYAASAKGGGIQNDSAEVTDVGSNGFGWTSIGTAYNPNFEMDGEIVEVLQFNAFLSQGQLDTVLDALAAKHAGLGL